MAQHTPGPWKATALHGDSKRAVTNADNVLVADCYADTHEDLGLPVEYKANARLIAAAPDLLDAVYALLDEHADCKGCHASELAFAAIAKAEGR